MYADQGVRQKPTMCPGKQQEPGEKQGAGGHECVDAFSL